MTSKRHAWIAGLLLIVPLLPAAPAGAETPGDAVRELTLVEAIDRALEASPDLAAERATVARFEADVVTARTWPFNPELTVGAGRRRSAPGTGVTDREVGLRQEFELGGKRRLRVQAAGKDLDAARARLQRAERRVAATAAAAFVLAQRACELVEIEREARDMARRMLAIEQTRLAAGAVTRIEVNLARARLGRQAVRLAGAEAGCDAARAELARAVGLSPREPPRPAGRLEAPALDLPGDPGSRAIEHRADLFALRHAVEASRSRIDLARRRVMPNLVGELAWAREEGTDRVWSGAVGVTIPLFNRRKGEIARAGAEWKRDAARVRSLELQVLREVAETAARYRAAMLGVQEMQRNVVGSLSESLRLIERSFSAGKIGWTDVIVFTAEFLDARRESTEVLAQAWLAAIELDLAAGGEALLRHGEVGR